MTTQDTNHDTAAGEVVQEQVVATDHSLLALAAFVCTYVHVYVGLLEASLGHSNDIKALTPPTTNLPLPQLPNGSIPVTALHYRHCDSQTCTIKCRRWQRLRWRRI